MDYDEALSEYLQFERTFVNIFLYSTSLFCMNQSFLGTSNIKKPSAA